MASYGKLSLFAAGDDGPPQCVLGDAQGHPFTSKTVIGIRALL
jgi:hypothetical protein